MVRHADQPLEHDPEGVERFKGNKIVRFLLDAGPFDLNQLSLMPFAREDWVQFAQLIGYSACGWGELSYVTDDDWNRVMNANVPR